jgi:phenylalanyl-tRNA synthetase beta chain
MKFSEQWLREWVDPPVTTEQLAEQLTMAGLEVDSLAPVAGEFSGVVVGEVLEVKPHPDAAKLRVCRVNVAEGEPLQIVCGAPNVYAGMRAPTALVGAVLPGGFKIKRAKLRGVESLGMLCSARELELSEAAEGLMELPPDAPVGKDIRDYLALDDVVVDVDLTPNRGDCLGVAGIAREVGVLNRLPVTGPDIQPVTASIADRFPVTVAVPDACPRYLGRVITGVDTTAQTPLWMQEKLRRSGIRSLGPVVDVTNYVLLELGQPMHAFDLDELDGGISVRMARNAETLVLLDGRTVELDADTLLITDANKALALAGIMGGENSGVSDVTRSLFLECAFFTPEAIAGRARRYGLQTDSSHRFERGVDPELQFRAIERATQLLLSLVGGEAGPVIDVSDPARLPQVTPIQLRRRRLRRLLGVELPDEEVVDILLRLGAHVESSEEGWLVIPPSFRFDLSIETDLIEELGRVHGYDRIPSSLPSGHSTMVPQPEARVARERISETLVDRGYQEAITYSFVDPQTQSRLDPEAAAVFLSNPISSEMSVMRTSLWPGLLTTLQHNRSRQQKRVRIFEQGLRFIHKDDEYKQENVLSALVCGSLYPEQWGLPQRPVDFFDVKGDLEAVLTLGGRRDAFSFQAGTHPALHPGRAARVFCDDRPVGWLGNLHPELAQMLEIPDETVLFEIETAAIQRGIEPKFQDLSRFPSVRRDLAIVVDAAVSARSVRATVRAAGGEWLRELRVFDVYQGKRIETGRKSIALGLILQDSSRTLTDEDVDGVIARVTASLEQELGATLRD